MGNTDNAVKMMREIVSLIRPKDPLLADVLEQSADVIESQAKYIQTLNESINALYGASRLPGCTCLTPAEKYASQKG